MYYILTPFTWLLNFFYGLFDNYGIALCLFAVVVKLILFPVSIKSKKSMIQMNLLSGRMQQLQKQYGKDQQRYNMEVQKLYEREHVNPMGGCLWSFVPLFILIPLYNIIREPLHYLMGLTNDQIATVANILNWNTVAVERGWIKVAADAFQNSAYNQMYLASLINEGTLPAVQAALGEAGSRVYAMNFNFLGLDLAMLPTWKIWENPSWPVIGAFLLILISAGSGFLFSKISMSTNKMNNQPNEQAERTNRMMMWMMPLMSLWIGFAMPVALCLYWVAQNLLSMVQEVIAGKMLKKDYEAARIESEKRAAEAKEEEKRRKEEARLERARRAEEEKKNRGKKKEKKESDVPGINKDDSKVGIRAYARGRAYDPNRFGGVTPYVDPNERIAAENAAFEKKGKKAKKSEEMFVEEKKDEQTVAPVEEQVEVTAAPVVEETAPAAETAPVETEEIEIEVEQIEVEKEEEDV